MTPLELLEEENPDALTADGFETALIGVCHQFGRPPVATYDYDKCIAKLMEEGSSWEEAEEYFQFNTLGAYVGENTPVFIRLPVKKGFFRRVWDEILRCL